MMPNPIASIYDSEFCRRRISALGQGQADF
jgi:hypothetical protein